MYPIVFKWELKVKELPSDTDGLVNIDFVKHKAQVVINAKLKASRVTEVVCHEWAHLLAPTEREEHGPLWGAAYGLCYALCM